LRSRGLAVLPVGGETGKKPLVTWAKWTKPPATAFVDKLICRHPDANVGIICHLSRVTVVDIDDLALLGAMLERFGDTPLITRTPSGGYHIWYRHAGERCTNLRGEGLDVDIKGKGGFVVVPPSVARQGRHYGKPYVFERGSWADLGRLPRIRDDSLPMMIGGQGNNCFASAKATPLRSIAVGRRNDTLFRLLLRQAPYCDTFNDLVDVAFTINDGSLEEPLPPAEVATTASSVWRYEQRGENWAGREARAVIDRSTFEILQQNPDAYVLWTKLKIEHGARKEAFAVCPEAMAKNEVIKGWRDKRRYRKARDCLVEQGLLDPVHIGGRGTGDPHLFRLRRPSVAVESKGARNAPNTTEHPRPCPSDGSAPWPGTACGITDEMADPLTLGAKLRRLRQAEGLSQTELARRAGVSRTTVGNVETARLWPSAATLQRREAVLHQQRAA
jgi:DNA-binding XRE family transcriptional regulator